MEGEREKVAILGFYTESILKGRTFNKIESIKAGSQGKIICVSVYMFSMLPVEHL